MRVVQAERFGGPEVLVVREVDEPAAGDGEAVVEVEAADTLFVETMIRRGAARAWFPVELPYLPGSAVAGRVRAAGGGVDPGWVGREVVAYTERGGYAERVVVPVEAMVAVPSGLGTARAAALSHDGVTAFTVFDAAGVKPGDWVLVTAAAGGMGILLVQLARAAGARVAAAARGGAKLGLARELGAELVVDYTGPGWAEHVRVATGGAGAAVVFDGAGGEIGRTAFQVTADGGHLSAHGAAAGGFASVDPAEAARRGVTVRGILDVRFTLADRTTLAARAFAEAAAGRLTPVIGRTFPLAHAADAHTAIESRAVAGKTLLVP